jgi:anti-sigma factor (TIGR02949 family)
VSGTRMTCEEALRRLAEYLDGELGPDAGGEVQRHLDVCRSCFSRAEFERKLRQRVAELRQGAVEAAFEGRIRALLRGFAAPPPLATSPEGGAEAHGGKEGDEPWS